jgi:hypothetical protein
MGATRDEVDDDVDGSLISVMQEFELTSGLGIREPESALPSGRRGIFSR